MRARKREGPGVVYISCLLTWLCGQAANTTQGKEQVVLFLCLLLWLRFSKRLPPLLSLSFYQSFFSPPPSCSLSLSLSRPEQSRVQRFPLLTRTSTTRACNYLSLKLQSFFFLLKHFVIFFFIRGRTGVVPRFKSNLNRATCQGGWSPDRSREELREGGTRQEGCFLGIRGEEGTLLVGGGGKSEQGGERCWMAEAE